MFIQLVITDVGQYQNGIDEIINVNLNQPVKIPKNSYVKVSQVFCQKDPTLANESLFIFCQQFSSINSQFVGSGDTGTDRGGANQTAGFLCSAGEFQLTTSELQIDYGTPILPLNNAGDLDINELTFKFLDYDGDTFPIGKITKFYMVLTITDDLDLL